jgi:hypothetical protein
MVDQSSFFIYPDDYVRYIVVQNIQMEIKQGDIDIDESTLF